MKAIVHDSYGSPDVLGLEEIDKPVIGDDQVLVRVKAAAVNPLDWHFMRGTPYLVRIQAGLSKPKRKTRGADLAGQVEAVGKNVTRFHPGDAVFADISTCGWGGFADYVAADVKGYEAEITFGTTSTTDDPAVNEPALKSALTITFVRDPQAVLEIS